MRESVIFDTRVSTLTLKIDVYFSIRSIFNIRTHTISCSAGWISRSYWLDPNRSAELFLFLLDFLEGRGRGIFFSLSTKSFSLISLLSSVYFFLSCFFICVCVCLCVCNVHSAYVSLVSFFFLSFFFRPFLLFSFHLVSSAVFRDTTFTLLLVLLHSSFDFKSCRSAGILRENA
jgi:hypothetical protein